MDPPVSLQVGGPAEAFSAILALVGLVTRVAFAVFGESLGLQEGLLTPVALVGPLIRVKAPMPQEVGLLAEAFATVRTLVSSLAHWWFPMVQWGF